MAIWPHYCCLSVFWDFTVLEVNYFTPYQRGQFMVPYIQSGFCRHRRQTNWRVPWLKESLCFLLKMRLLVSCGNETDKVELVKNNDLCGLSLYRPHQLLMSWTITGWQKFQFNSELHQPPWKLIFHGGNLLHIVWCDMHIHMQQVSVKIERWQKELENCTAILFHLNP